jgi:hypothetical protein
MAILNKKQNRNGSAPLYCYNKSLIFNYDNTNTNDIDNTGINGQSFVTQ